MSTYCFFSAQFLPTIGGVERYTYGLAKKMLEHGHRVFVVTSALPNLPERENLDGIEVYRLPSHLLASGRLPLLKKNAQTRQLLAQLAEEGIERIIIQTRLYRLSLLGLKFAREQGISAIIIEHGSNYVSHENPVVSTALRIYEHLLLAWVKKYDPPVYGVSVQSCEWLRRLGFVPSGVLHNSIDLNAVLAEAAGVQRDFCAENNVSPENICVAYAGRLIAGKGAPKLAEAVVQYNKSRKQDEPPFTLFVAGDGPLGTEHFPKDAAVILLGALPHGETMGLFSQCDVFCLPCSIPEGLPTTVLEAAACRCFIISSDRGGTLELISGEEFGIIVPDNEPGTLAAALAYATNNASYREKATQMAYERVSDHFTFDTLYGAVSMSEVVTSCERNAK